MTFETVIKLLMLAIFTSSIFFFALAVGHAEEVPSQVYILAWPHGHGWDLDGVYTSRDRCHDTVEMYNARLGKGAKCVAYRRS